MVANTNPFQFARSGFTELDVLPQLIGQRLDDYARGVIISLRPTVIRLVEVGDEVKTDAMLWRVTVKFRVDDEHYQVIDRITQEVAVGLPEGVPNGYAMGVELRKRGVELYKIV